MEVKYIHESKIEPAAYKLLGEYGQKFGEVAHPPIPVEEIIESCLQLDYGFDDLPSSLEIPDVLGATWVQLKKIRIDQSLDPSEYPAKIGRYCFTVAHEIGHWQLHRSQILENSSSLFETPQKPAIVCRKVSGKKPIEKQADKFAGYLLMPKQMVQNKWTEVFGNLEPYVAVDEISDLSERWGLAEDDQPTVQRAKQLAKIFNVSGQAMQIRLINMKLILTEKPDKGLF